jgi:hypothetical protein
MPCHNIAMADKYRIQSVIVSPSGWLFETTSARSLSKKLTFTSPKKHGETRHIVSYECVSASLDEAWRSFYKEVDEFIEAAAFHTSSYLSFHDWNHVITNQTKRLCMIVIFPRTLGTPLSLYNQERVDDVNKIIAAAKTDKKLKKFLHCYRMAILVDAPETHDAYEKYLILASEALAGEVNVVDGGFVRRLFDRLGLVKSTKRMKYDRKRLIQIIGKELHKYFFSSLNPEVGKTIRNANMHDGKSPNDKPSETIRLVNKLREFVANEYDLKDMSIIKEENSPTRGLYRDDGQILFLSGDVETIDLQGITDLEVFIKALPKGVKVLSGKEAQVMLVKSEE